MNARHRVSKMLLRHGRVYPKPSSTWSRTHRQWLAAQQFPDPVNELAYVDLLAAVDGLTARKQALAERISRLAIDPEWWPTIARLRCFRGVDTLTAFSVHLELSADWERFEKAHRVGAWLGLTHHDRSPASQIATARSPRPGPGSRAGCWSSPPGITLASPRSGPRSLSARPVNPTTFCRSLTAPSIASTASTPGCVPAASRTT